MMMRLLRTASVGLIVEGIRGIFDGATLQHERVFLKQRKGFVKIALQAGVGACCVQPVRFPKAMLAADFIVPGGP